jgi:hypothetical protein
MFIVVRTFRLKSDVREEAFLAANERMQTAFVYHQPGFVRRTTARGEDGEWLVIGVWSTRHDAEKAGTLASDDPVAREANAMIDAASLTVKRFETLD